MQWVLQGVLEPSTANFLFRIAEHPAVGWRSILPEAPAMLF
jgi:hypothetical protein